MNIQELETMPISFLRNVDVRTIEEEKILQEIINKKLAALPVPVAQVLSLSSETDNMTIEKELALQAKIDARNEENRKRLQSAVESVTKDSIEAPVETSIVTEVVVAETVILKKFCEFCDSKRRFHKKECTRVVV